LNPRTTVIGGLVLPALACNAAAVVDFNVHYHQGKEVVYPARLAQAAAGRLTLVVTSAQDYCWMWTNKTQGAAHLALALHRQP
jgi:hypothetical protein